MSMRMAAVACVPRCACVCVCVCHRYMAPEVFRHELYNNKVRARTHTHTDTHTYCRIHTYISHVCSYVG